MRAKIGKRTQLNLKSSARFFAERLSGDIGGRLDALDKTARDYLQKVAKVLGKRPDLDMRICGVAAEDDRKALARLTGIETKARSEAKRRGVDIWQN